MFVINSAPDTNLGQPSANKIPPHPSPANAGGSASGYSTKEPSYPTSRRGLTSLIGFVAIVAILHWAQAILIPMALAVLASFILVTAVTRLEHFGIRRVLSVVCTVLISFGMLGSAIWIMSEGFVQVAHELDAHRDTINEKFLSLQGPIGAGIAKAKGIFEELGKEGIDSIKFKPAKKRGGTTPAAAKVSADATPVEVVGTHRSPLEIIRGLAGSLLSVFASALLVIVFTIFILIHREDLRNRFIRLIPRGHMSRITLAIDEAVTRVSSYLRMQCLVNLSFGVALSAVLLFLGIPSALFCGLLAGLLRFIPYFGVWIASFLPLALSLAAFDGWHLFLFTASAFLLIECIWAYGVEPYLYGASTGLSPIAILAATVFWAWLWGGLGLLIATPLTVCLVVLGSYVPQLEFLNILLSDEQVLTPSTRLYQRLLAGDQDEAAEIAASYLKTNSLKSLYEAVFFPALIQCRDEHQRGSLDEPSRDFVYQGMRELVVDLNENNPANLLQDAEDKQATEVQLPGANSAPRKVRPALTVFSVPARTEADEIAGMMCMEILKRELESETNVSIISLKRGETPDSIALSHDALACISILPPFSLVAVRNCVKRIKSRFANATITISYWSDAELPEALMADLKSYRISAVVTNITGVVYFARNLASANFIKKSAASSAAINLGTLQSA